MITLESVEMSHSKKIALSIVRLQFLEMKKQTRSKYFMMTVKQWTWKCIVPRARLPIRCAEFEFLLLLLSHVELIKKNRPNGTNKKGRHQE
jgi:hypothetical protein